MILGCNSLTHVKEEKNTGKSLLIGFLKREQPDPMLSSHISKQAHFWQMRRFPSSLVAEKWSLMCETPLVINQRACSCLLISNLKAVWKPQVSWG